MYGATTVPVLVAVLAAAAFRFSVPVQGCALCYMRLPPRPPPIDHLWLSALEQVYLPDTVAELCNISQRLQLSDHCRRGIVQLFCSLAQLIEYKSMDCTKSQQQCANCMATKANIVHRTSWLITWLDSFGKMPSAVSEGNYYWLGDYEQCDGLRKQNHFDGRYCRILLDIPSLEHGDRCPSSEKLKIQLGVCVPAQCSTNEITLLSHMTTPYAVNAECELAQSWPLSSLIFLLLLSIWLLALIAATIFEVYHDDGRSMKRISLLAQCLSIRRNGELALSTKRNHDYHSVQGLQVITLALIISANCWIYITPYIENVIYSYDSVYKWQLHFLNNFSYHTDALIAMSALFTCVTVTAPSTRRTLLDLATVLLDRVLDMLPSFTFLVMFMALVFERLASGPIWMHDNLTERCRSSWWTNLLFINNLLPAQQTCLDGAYMYSLEVQFLLILVPMIYFSQTNRTTILALTVSAFFASITYTLYQCFINQLPPTIMLTAEPIPMDIYQQFVDKIFTKPWTRAPAFIIGFLFSFLFTEQLKLNSVHLWMIRLVGLFIGIFIVFALYPYSITIGTPNWNSKIFLSLYATVHRPLWATVVCAVIYLSYHNRNFQGRFSQFLEWRVFAPLAKHTLLVLLISEPVSLYLFSSLHRPLHATTWTLLNITIGTVILSYVTAFVLEVFISMPLRQLIGLMINLQRFTSDRRSMGRKEITNSAKCENILDIIEKIDPLIEERPS